jgi:hypothetical protein
VPSLVTNLWQARPWPALPAVLRRVAGWTLPNWKC